MLEIGIYIIFMVAWFMTFYRLSSFLNNWQSLSFLSTSWQWWDEVWSCLFLHITVGLMLLTALSIMKIILTEKLKHALGIWLILLFFFLSSRKEEITAENTRVQQMHITVLLHLAKNNDSYLTLHGTVFTMKQPKICTVG